MNRKHLIYPSALAFLLLSACDTRSESTEPDPETSPVSIERTGWLSSPKLKEASGIQASYSRKGDFFLHNDEGKARLYTSDEAGTNLGHISVVPAKNKDWEDITSVPVEDGRWIVIGDIGDNKAKRKFIKLYFIEEPKTGKNDRYSGEQPLTHWLELTYPDGPRDCESMAYDPIGRQILFLSKRDKPSRLYAIDLQTALTQKQAELEFLGTIAKLRPPTLRDHAQFGGRTDFISQPTGFDISPDGSEAAIITYRSLYHFVRLDGEDWLSTLQKTPTEIVGPKAVQNEAISYSVDGKSIFVTTEKRPSPLFRIQFTE